VSLLVTIDGSLNLFLLTRSAAPLPRKQFKTMMDIKRKPVRSMLAKKLYPKSKKLIPD
jgi:hypothetical protein